MHLRYLISAAIAFSLTLLSATSSLAESIPSTLNVDQREAVYSWSATNMCGPYACSGSLQATCDCVAVKSTGCGADPTVTLSCGAINEPTAGMYFVNNRGESAWSYATRYCDPEYPFNQATLMCEKQTYSCPAGYTRSTDQLSCTRPDCAEGQYRDEGSGQCVPEKGLGPICV